jgi:hypothetical protein
MNSQGQNNLSMNKSESNVPKNRIKSDFEIIEVLGKGSL